MGDPVKPFGSAMVVPFDPEAETRQPAGLTPEEQAIARSKDDPGGPIKYGYSNGYENVKNHPGLIEPGNLDLSKRQMVEHPDGSYGSEYSGTYNIGGKEVLLPTIFDGKVNSDEAAIARYLKTGEHMGKFAEGDYANSDAYASKIHQRKQYVGGKEYRGQTTPQTPEQKRQLAELLRMASRGGVR